MHGMGVPPSPNYGETCTPVPSHGYVTANLVNTVIELTLMHLCVTKTIKIITNQENNMAHRPHTSERQQPAMIAGTNREPSSDRPAACPRSRRLADNYIAHAEHHTPHRHSGPIRKPTSLPRSSPSPDGPAHPPKYQAGPNSSCSPGWQLETRNSMKRTPHRRHSET